ncbi:MAG: DUF4293 domain-containing protein [Marinilabiliaceae bacterium]|jgi:hypothetical protein|nr:DUF4293 domain-containing protein [Marinilabiliaceae bacterium]
MIQRIQTLYLAIAAALAGVLLNGIIISLVGAEGEAFTLTYKGISILRNGISEMLEKSLPLTILLIAVPLLYFMAIFLFKNRKLQIRIVVLTTLLNAGSFLLILYYILYAGNKFEAAFVFNLKITFPVIGVILGYLAFRSILKDELLVKSYDRIR